MSSGGPMSCLSPRLLSDPFLQYPTLTSVQVVWFTEFEGIGHTVQYGESFAASAIASTTQLTRVREDRHSHWSPQEQEPGDRPIQRNIWRHEAAVTGLQPGQRIPYRVESVTETGQAIVSGEFTLAPQPPPGTSLKILLTSDHQLKPLVAANLQKVVETVGQVDAVFFAGDLINTPDRASEWFDDRRGGAFFPALQGRADYALTKAGQTIRYHGGEIIQHAPLFPAIGNHEVMGRFSETAGLDAQFGDAFPRAIAQTLYQGKPEVPDPGQDPVAYDRWLKDHSFNTDTYEEIFSLPQDSPGGKRHYAVTFGDVRLITLYVTNLWRSPDLSETTKGKYCDRVADFENPEQWGYGQPIFESITQGSPQYRWLETELAKPEFQQAQYKVVMLHHPPHSLGFNSVPAFTNPVQIIERDDQGKITAIRYEYPQDQDQIVNDLVPLLEKAGVQLVFYGHSHLWNRFVSPSGMHFLESSNVGNSYGAYVGHHQRPVPIHYQERYAAQGNPNGLAPVTPSLAPLLDEANNPMPYLSSNDLTAFSVLHTGTGTVSSYYFDTRQPDNPVIEFDCFTLSTDTSNYSLINSITTHLPSETLAQTAPRPN